MKVNKDTLMAMKGQLSTFKILYKLIGETVKGGAYNGAKGREDPFIR